MDVLRSVDCLCKQAPVMALGVMIPNGVDLYVCLSSPMPELQLEMTGLFPLVNSTLLQAVVRNTFEAAETSSLIIFLRLCKLLQTQDVLLANRVLHKLPCKVKKCSVRCTVKAAMTCQH